MQELKDIRKLEIMIRQRKEQVERLRQAALLLGAPSLNSDRVQTSGNGTLMEDAVIRLVEMEKQVEELVGCHRQTVRRILKETGKLDEAKLDTGKVMALHQAGWSVNDIAGEMGCSIQYIEKTLQEFKSE